MLNYKREIETLTALVIEKGASDLHISAFRHPIIRISGDLSDVSSHPVYSAEDAMSLLFVFISDEEKKVFFEKKDIDFSHTTKDGYRFRGNAYFQKGFVSIALRLIPKEIKTITELNLPPILESFTQMRQGFFLVVGPVGQGKSTTLASMIQLINKTRKEHILTIEDPIEYLFKDEQSIVEQREVRFDTTSFHAALRAMFREDVNVAMIGEMRDSETISTAVTAAETGHLILSTLHTNNAAQTMDRIIDSFPAGQQGQIKLQLAATLIAVLSERLVPRINGGRMPAYELLINNNAVGNLVREGRTNEINVVLETGSEDGMIDMNHSLSALVNQGEVDPEVALKYSYDPQGLEKML